MRYNYVIFNYTDSISSFDEEEDYYALCLRDLKNRNDIILNHIPLQEKSSFIRFLYRLSNWRFWGKVCYHLRLQKLWYPYIYENVFQDDKPICFVCLRYPSIDYLRYLKKRYPNSKIVKMSRDIIRTQREIYEKYSKANIFDLWLSYDKNDCKEYGFLHFDEFESKIEISASEQFPTSDFFFAGRAKDRYSLLVELYDKLEQQGFNCLFYLVGVKEADKMKRKGIKYADTPMSYLDMLRYSINSKCLLDINQEGALGYTSRFIEAVMFDKYLLTNNIDVTKSKFYNSNYIKVINKIEDIDASFINGHTPEYNYDGDFSPLKRIEYIDKMLSK